MPGPLPVGERLLWQGAPRWQTLACRVLHVPKLAVYFTVLLAWYVVSQAAAGTPAATLAMATARFAGLALTPIGLLMLYAWLTSRTTTYTVTSRRVVMRFGLALPMTLNLPYRMIDSAAFKPGSGGTGDVSLAPAASERLAYPLLWPHARPWRMGRGEPTLRAIPDAARVAQMLGRALAAAASVPVQAAPEMPTDATGQRAAVGARAAA